MEKFNFNNSCYFGVGVTDQIVTEIKNHHYEKGFIITDNGLIEAGIYQKIASLLSHNKIPSVMFSDVGSEPTVKDIKNAYNELKRAEADFIIAIGGGSSIDTAKALSIIVTNPKYEDVVSLRGKKNDLNHPLPVFAIPTTAGSGAEISKSFVFEDEVSGKMVVCENDKCLPVATFIDAELMVTMPDIVTLSSGFDALTHAIESLLSKNANRLSKTLASEAIKYVVKNLPKSYDEPEDIEARENMAYAEYIAGLAYSNSGLGICHSMAHAVCGKFKIQHGIALSIILPVVLKFNMYSKSASEFKVIAEAFDIKTDGLSVEEVCRTVIKKIKDFRDDFNIPKKLSDYGVHEEDLDILSLSAFEDACTLSNPRDVTMTDIYMLFKKLI